MAFGYNDLELMIRDSYSFAVRNAVQELKDAANFITRSNETKKMQLWKQSFRYYPYKEIAIKKMKARIAIQAFFICE